MHLARIAKLNKTRPLSSLKSILMVNYIIFGIILLHLIVGFGWLIYKLEIQKEKPKKDNSLDNENKQE